MIIDLCCGKGGWYYGAPNEEWIGYDVVDLGYPGQLVLQDIRTIRGDLLKEVDFIVASPPCTEFSKWGQRGLYPHPPKPDMSLVNACYRIAREAERPIVLENVKGAEYFLGKARCHRGAFYLWGDVPMFSPGRYIKGMGNCKTKSVHGAANRAFIPRTLARSVCDAMLDYPARQ